MGANAACQVFKPYPLLILNAGRTLPYQHSYNFHLDECPSISKDRS
jgi:hypothetical protein